MDGDCAAVSAFAYDENGDMLAEGVALEAIARQVGTPFYCYSAAALRAGWQEFADGMKGMERLRSATRSRPIPTSRS